MKFTILVAAYNAKEYLPQCLDSLFAQTEKSVQVICIDDCSTDESLALQQKYTKQKGCILVIQTPQNSGQAEARNLGLQYAVGELTLMVDADDWLAPDCLEKIWEVYKQADDIDAVMMRLMLVEKHKDGKMWAREWNESQKLPRIMSGHEACIRALRREVHGLYAVRTSIHKEHPFDTTARLYSDDNTTYAHYLRSRKVAQSEGQYFYRQHAESTTHQTGLTRLMFIRANMSLRAQLENLRIGDEGLRLCEDHCWKNFIGIYRQMQKLKKTATLTENEVAEIDATLEDAYNAMRLERINLHRWPYSWFKLKQKCIYQVKRFVFD